MKRTVSAIVLLLVLVGGFYLWRSRAKKPRVTMSADQVQKVAAGLTPLPDPFPKVLLSMHKLEPQKGIDGAMHDMGKDVGIPALDGAYIYQLAREMKPKQTMEVGLAEGVSTMYFLAAIKANGGGMHVAMDPFEDKLWHGIGLQKVAEVQMKDHFRFMDAFSIAAIPELAKEKQSFGIIFIDGDHRFDGQMIDFLTSDEVCPEGCYILFHDIWMDATKRLVSFIEKNRADYARRPVPAGVNIAAFEKIGRDRRNWDHYVDF